MDETQFIQFARESVLVMLKVASPIMLIGLVVGLVIAIFQALTSIQEMSLTFVPKILAVFVSLIILLPFMFGTMSKYMEGIVDRIIGVTLAPHATGITPRRSFCLFFGFYSCGCGSSRYAWVRGILCFTEDTSLNSFYDDGCVGASFGE